MYFVAHVTREERRVVLTAIVLGAVAPFAIEATGWFAPAYAFEPGRIVLLSRVIDFPKVPSLVSLIETNATFVALPAIFAGWMHDELMSAAPDRVPGVAVATGISDHSQRAKRRQSERVNSRSR